MTIENNSKTSRFYNMPRNSYEGDTFILEDLFVVNEDSGDRLTYVLENEAGRLDLVSYRMYKNPMLSWVIARRNKLNDLNDIWVGKPLYIPNVSTVYSTGGILEPV